MLFRVAITNCSMIDREFLRGIIVWMSAVLGVLTLFLGQNLYAQESLDKKASDQILALGMARVVEGNAAAARQNAISMAISRGVEYYLVTRLGKKTVADHLDRLVEGILPRAKELVEYYHVVKEAELGDRYTLLLQMKINEKLATDRLLEEGLLSAEATPLKILFLVGNMAKGSSEYWWTKPEEIPPLSPAELALLRAFQDKGFDLIDRTISLPSTEVTPEMRQAELSPILIKGWGDIFGADVVVYGKSEVNDLGEISMTLQVVGVADGFVHCELSETGSTDAQGGPQEVIAVLEGIVSRIMPRLETCVNEAGGAEEVIYNSFEVTLKELKNYMQYKKLRDFMSKEIPGVKEFRQSRIGSHYVSFRVEFQGNEEKFADLVMYHDALPVPIMRVERKEGEVVFVVGQEQKR